MEAMIEFLFIQFLIEGTDFLVKSCKHPLNDKVAAECGFTSLSILNSLNSHPLFNFNSYCNASCLVLLRKKFFDSSVRSL